MNDADILARTIFGEARGEGALGMKAVGGVIRNRVNVAQDFVDSHIRPHPLFGDGSYIGACKAPYQFSCWNKNDPNLPQLLAVSDNDAIFLSCTKFAADIIDGSQEDVTNEATYYYDRRMPAPPRWAKDKLPCMVIGHHLFFNNI